MINPFSISRITVQSVKYGALAYLVCALIFNAITLWLDLPDNKEADIMQVLSTPIGILTVTIISPLIEELLFRFALIEGVLCLRCRPWLAVLLSATLFSLAHFNPSQSFCAFGMGIVFGIIYLHHRSIAFTALLHIINNVAGVIILLCFPD